jgi:hypothetical protein
MRFLLASVALLVCLAAGAYGMLRWRADDPGKIIEADLADAHFVFPAAYARDEATTAGGFTDRLAFAAIFPDFSPRRLGFKAPAPSTLAVRGQNTVFVTISLKEDAIDPMDRPTNLYARFLEGDAWTGPGGLVMRRFEQGSPYDLEQLYIAPPDGRGFFARCPKPQAPGAAPEDACLSVFRTGALDVELRFAPALLEHWEALVDGARAFVDRILAGGRRK